MKVMQFILDDREINPDKQGGRRCFMAVSSAGAGWLREVAGCVHLDLRRRIERVQRVASLQSQNALKITVLSPRTR